LCDGLSDPDLLALAEVGSVSMYTTCAVHRAEFLISIRPYARYHADALGHARAYGC
jgi:hypothetical protein